jgi:membrane fusion protein, multidrug efflux system
MGVGSQTSFAQTKEAPPLPVVVLTAQAKPIALTDTLPGRVVAYSSAEIRPQIAGLIQERLFEEGSKVEAGQPLYQIDPVSYEATLNAARGDLAKFQANLSLNEKKLTRYQSLLKTQAASRQAYDDAVGAVAEARAAVAAAQAHVEKAQIDLKHTLLTAPISGVIGRSNVTAGALVTANQTASLATITALDPVYVDMIQSSSKLLDLRQKIASGIIEGTENVPLTLILNGQGMTYPHKGSLKFSEVVVDERTSSVSLRALFPNPDKVLLPGMFVRTEVSQGRIANGILIPLKAVLRTPTGSPFVWIADETDSVARRSVVIERAIGDSWLIRGGIKEGDRVIVEGTMKASDGAKVMIKVPDEKPTAPATPTAPSKEAKNPSK